MDITPLPHIPEAAHKVFNRWKSNAQEFHKHADFYTEKDSLTKDFTKALQQSLNDVAERNYKKNRERKGWGTNVFLERLSMHLNYHWYNIFVLASYPEYKSIVWLRSMMTYMEKNMDAVKKVNRMYTMAIEKRFPFEDFEEYQISKEEAEQNKLIADLNFESNWEENKTKISALLRERFEEEVLDNRGQKLIKNSDLIKVLGEDNIYNFLELNLHILG